MKQDMYRWNKESQSIFESFAAELTDFWEGGSVPKNSSKMLENALKMQRDEMRKNNLSMSYEMIPNGHFANVSVGKSWKDALYINEMECRTCNLTRRIYKAGKQIYKEKEDVNFYQIITNALQKESIQNEEYSCPNCGAVSTILQLEDGCKYCGTKFTMSDLYPKVTNFYTIRAYGGTDAEMKQALLKIYIPLMFVGTAFFTWYFSAIKIQSEYFILNLLSGIFAGGISGFILGYLIYVFKLVGSLFVNAGKSIPMLVNTSGSQQRFVSLVQRHSPEFSYEFFSDKVVTILCQLLSEERIEDNPYYVGVPTNIDSTSIIEYSFKGAVALKNCTMQGDICNTSVLVYMTDYYCHGTRIKKKDDIFRISLRKDLSKTMNYHFSLSAIHCKSCGASFDATKTKVCPFCQNTYMIGDDDWIVTDIKKLKR